MKVTVRQLNGCLSAMQIVRIKPEVQKSCKELIQLMIENKTNTIDITDDEFAKAVIEMNSLYSQLEKAQGGHKFIQTSLHKYIQNAMRG